VGRCWLVWTSGTVVLATAARLARAPAEEGWSARHRLAALPFDRALVDLAAAALLACVAWAWLALSATVVEALRAPRVAGVRPGRPVRGVRRVGHAARLPGGLRRLVLAGCGVAMLSGLAAPALAAGGRSPAPPAHASPLAHRDRGLSVLVGLPLPERAVAPRAPQTRPRPTLSVVVRSGDCLWSIAARDLPADASPVEVAHRWHALYAANHDLIGPDPDVIEPGQRLRLPVRTPVRKDPS
jgi:nucleoid-associated protein YgaU